MVHAVAKVQRTASSAMKWLSGHGGKVLNQASDTISQLSKMGAHGKHPGNAERDAHRMIRRLIRLHTVLPSSNGESCNIRRISAIPPYDSAT